MIDERKMEVWPGSEGIPLQTYYTGLWLVLAAIVMLFAGLTSALVVRKGLSNDWKPLALPPVLYYSIVLLVAGSVWIELGRRQFRDRLSTAALKVHLGPVLVLGAAFLGVQLLAWRELHGRGILLGTNPSSSFFYLLTATYAVLLAGGLAGIGSVILRAKYVASARQGAATADLVAIYWHFMTGLWIYLLVLLALNM